MGYPPFFFVEAHKVALVNTPDYAKLKIGIEDIIFSPRV